MKKISIFLAFVLIFALCGGSQTSEEPVLTTLQDTTTTVQDTTTTTLQDTTTTVQDTTTTTLQDTTTNETEENSEQCGKGSTSDKCMEQYKQFCEANPNDAQCADYDPSKMSEGDGTQGMSNMSGSGSMPGNDNPPLLKNLLIGNWGPYDSSTGVSGDFEFRSDLQLVFFDEFGRVHSAGTPGAYDNPTFEYKVPRDTLVYIPIDGVIDFFQFQPTTSYKQDDWELMIKPSMNSDWAVVIDHVVSLNCDRSSRSVCQDPLTVNGVEIYSRMQVKAGDLLGYVGNYEDGEGGSVFGRTEITIGKYVRAGNQQDFNNFCPTNYLDPSVKDSLLASVTAIMASYESWLGDSSFYDEANMVSPGCWYSEIFESNGKTTPKK